MKLQERINEMIREQSVEHTEFMDSEYEEADTMREKLKETLKFLFEGKLNNVIEDLQGVSINKVVNKVLYDLSAANTLCEIIMEEKGYYKGLRDGLKLASNFEIMGIPIQLKLLDKPAIQLHITDVDRPGDNEPV